MQKDAFKFRISAELLKRTRDYADQSGRSVASVICEALFQFLKGKGK